MEESLLLNKETHGCLFGDKGECMEQARGTQKPSAQKHLRQGLSALTALESRGESLKVLMP